MSILHPFRAGPSGPPRTWLLAIGWAVLVALTPSRARSDSAIDAWAQWLVSQGAYKGPWVPYPDAVPRPVADAHVLHSVVVPVSVHAGDGVPEARVARALDALERGWQRLHAHAWPLPPPDGGHGGSLGYDVYLTQRERPAGAAVEHPVAWSDTDAATSHGWLDPYLDSAELEACALWTLAEAGLVGLDPAEAEPLRRASVAAEVYVLTGGFGCGDDAREAQAHPERGFLGEGLEGPDATALYLAAIGERNDATPGRFVRALWELGRQASGETARLHGQPDLPMVLERALSQGGEQRDQVAVDVAVARYFAGPPERARHATYPAFAALGPDAAVPVVEARSFAELPQHLPSALPALDAMGSAYVRVDTRGAAAGARLKVWLKGERGARWSLVAVRLGADGGELGRVEAPARTRVPEAYLPLELTPDTARVLLVVTHLPATPLSARSKQDPPLPGPRSFRLILDR